MVNLEESIWRETTSSMSRIATRGSARSERIHNNDGCRQSILDWCLKEEHLALKFLSFSSHVERDSILDCDPCHSPTKTSFLSEESILDWGSKRYQSLLFSPSSFVFPLSLPHNPTPFPLYIYLLSSSSLPLSLILLPPLSPPNSPSLSKL